MSNEEKKILDEEVMTEDVVEGAKQLEPEAEPVKLSRLEAEMLNMEKTGCPKILTYRVGINGCNEYSLKMELDPSVEDADSRKDSPLLIQDVIKANAFIKFATLQSMIDRHHIERIGKEQAIKEAKNEVTPVYTKEDIEQAIAETAWINTLINSMNVQWTMNMLSDFKNTGHLEGVETSDIENWNRILLGISNTENKNSNDESHPQSWDDDNYKEEPISEEDNIENSEFRTIIEGHEDDLTLLDELKNCYTISAKNFLHYFPECDFTEAIESRDLFAKMHADDILATVRDSSKTYTVKEFVDYVIQRLDDVNPEATPDKDFKNRLWYMTLITINNLLKTGVPIDTEKETLSSMEFNRAYRIALINTDEELFADYPLYPEEIAENEADICILNVEEMLNIAKRFVPSYKDVEYVYDNDITNLYRRINSVKFDGKEYSLTDFMTEIYKSLEEIDVETADVEDKEFKTRRWYTAFKQLLEGRKTIAPTAYGLYIDEDSVADEDEEDFDDDEF